MVIIACMLIALGQRRQQPLARVGGSGEREEAGQAQRSSSSSRWQARQGALRLGLGLGSLRHCMHKVGYGSGPPSPPCVGASLRGTDAAAHATSPAVALRRVLVDLVWPGQSPPALHCSAQPSQAHDSRPTTRSRLEIYDSPPLRGCLRSGRRRAPRLWGTGGLDGVGGGWLVLVGVCVCACVCDGGTRGSALCLTLARPSPHTITPGNGNGTACMHAAGTSRQAVRWPVRQGTATTLPCSCHARVCV